MGDAVPTFSGRTCEFARQSGIAGWREVEQSLPGLCRQFELAHEILKCLARDAMAARERLELLVRFRQAVTTHHGLHGFGEHFPARVEVGREAIGIHVELVEPAQQRVERDQGVAERGASG